MFKVGDLVQVRHHTEDEKSQYLFSWTTRMNKLEGNMYRIQEVIDGGYMVSDGKQPWALTEDSLRLVYEQF